MSGSKRSCGSAGWGARRLGPAVVAMLAAFGLGGCFSITQQLPSGEPLDAGRIKAIRPGVTTRAEILERFGPPAAIARKGTTMVLPAPGPAKRGRTEVPSDAFLELFAASRPLKDAELVYYYDASALKGSGFLFIPIIGGGFYSREAVAERLWILIDRDRGIVEDYVFRGAR